MVLSYIAKQPILDRDQRLYGYELLFRSSATSASFDGVDGTLATKQVIAQSVLDLGLETLVGQARAFVNFGREVLMEDWHVELPRQTAVIEILETVEPDAEVVQACRRLKDSGYLLALDDFVMRAGWEPLVAMADIIKVEMSALSDDYNPQLVRESHARGTRMLVERVETQDDFARAKAAGYDYFQGYYFARPAIMSSKQVPAIKVNCLKLIREAQRPELNFLQLERLIKSDVSLTYKLLKYVNSALFSHPSEIISLREALLFVPEPRLRRWIWLAAVPTLATDKPSELLTLAMIRAWMCEGLAGMTGVSKDEAFLVGLLSLLPALTDQTFEVTLAHLQLPKEMTAILLGHPLEDSGLATVFALAAAYESADWTAADALRHKLRLNPQQISGTYLQAVHEADRVRI